MKKIFSRILYALFFGFSMTLLVSCILLLVHNLRPETSTNEIEAIKIDDSSSASVYDRVDEVSLSAASSITEADCQKGYLSLSTPQEKELYRYLEDTVYKISKDRDDKGRYTTERIRLEGDEISEERLRHALNAFLFDNPQVFWLNNVFGYVHSDGYTIVECYTDISADECTAMIAEFTEKIDELLSDITPGMSAYSREKLIHDRLLSGCTYAEDIESFSDGWSYFSAYGAVVEGRAVCEGYAKAFQLLMTRAGLECCTIRGTAEDVPHMWNLVYLEGDWYHVDPTWDDTDDFINYEYFNADDETILRNHVIAEAMTGSEETDAKETELRNFFVPECPSKVMNYYYTEGYRITEFNFDSDEELAAFIASRISSGEQIIPIVISVSLDYSEVVDKFFYSSPYRFYYYIDKANETLDAEHQIDRNKIKLLRNENNRTLRVRLGLK